MTRSNLRPDLFPKDVGHDACDHKKAVFCHGINDDSVVSPVVVYECGTYATSDSAFGYISEEYERPCYSVEADCNEHLDCHTRMDLRTLGGDGSLPTGGEILCNGIHTSNPPKR